MATRTASGVVKLESAGTCHCEHVQIIKAHTVVAAPGYVVKEGKAAMGNYNHFMTIQEMTDLVAFLKHGLDGKGR